MKDMKDSDINVIWQQYAIHKNPSKEILRPFSIPERTLTGAGPSNCSNRTLHFLGQQVLGHFHPEILQLLDEIKAGLRYVFQTTNRLTLALSTAGHGGMEACLGNLLEPGDTLLVASCGFWGERAADMAVRIGANIKRLKTNYGVPFDLILLDDYLAKYRPTVVFVTHAESSTGMKQPLEGIGKLVRKYDALLIVDTVASLGGEPFFMDAWEVDAVYTGSQKVLNAPAGMAPVSFGPRAEKKIFQRKTKPAYYWDMQILGNYWNCFGDSNRVYHHTISVTLIYGLKVALMELAEEGLPVSWARHRATAAKFRESLRKRGLQCYIENPQFQLSTIISIKLPPGIDGNIIIRRAMKQYNVEISAGIGPTVGKILRVGLMGINAQPHIADLVLNALDDGFKHATQAKI